MFKKNRLLLIEFITDNTKAKQNHYNYLQR
jgi:hypothetical protein